MGDPRPSPDPRQSPHPRPGRVLVTTSWDDGHRLDRRLADDLARYGVAGTFYVAPRSHELADGDRLGTAGMRELAARFEIGSHTLSHARLTALPPDRAREEIVAGKAVVEDRLGTAVTSFCYPYGAFTDAHAVMARQAGFALARTVRRFVTDLPADPWRTPTSMHAAAYRRDALPVLARARGIGDVRRLWTSWDALARVVFAQARMHGGVFHLWGHSWEIDAHGDWDRLRSFLAFLANQDDVEFVTNAELARRARAGECR